MKILKELRKAINRNPDYWKKKLETIRKSKKIRKFICWDESWALGIERRKNKEEKRKSDIEVRIMEITQSEQRIEIQVRKGKKKKGI